MYSLKTTIIAENPRTALATGFETWRWIQCEKCDGDVVRFPTRKANFSYHYKCLLCGWNRYH